MSSATKLQGVEARRHVHPRGRWRRRKQVVRQLAADLGWPGCLAVASDDQIVAGVLAAGVRLRDWRRFEGGRRHPKVRRADAVLAGQRRRASRQLMAEDGVPF